MTHLEAYLDCLKLLPNELQRELVLMTELDRKAARVRREMEELQNSILGAASSDTWAVAMADGTGGGGGGGGGHGGQGGPLESQLLHLRHLQQMHVDLQNEKLMLATQSKDMIDGYLSRLNDEMELFRADLGPEEAARLLAEPFEDMAPKKKHGGSSGASRKSDMDGGAGRGKESRKKASSKKHADSDEEDEEDEEEDEGAEEEEEEEEEEAPEPEDSRTKKQRQSASAASASASVSAEAAGLAEATAAAGPDEERFCICRGPSYGQMIACDNEECPYQWFHFPCVGLKKQPTGTYYCDECLSKMPQTAPSQAANNNNSSSSNKQKARK